MDTLKEYGQNSISLKTWSSTLWTDLPLLHRHIMDLNVLILRPILAVKRMFSLKYDSKSQNLPQKWPPIIPVPRLKPITMILVTTKIAEQPTLNWKSFSPFDKQYPYAIKSAVGLPSLPKIGRGVFPLSMRVCHHITFRLESSMSKMRRRNKTR